MAKLFKSRLVACTKVGPGKAAERPGKAAERSGKAAESIPCLSSFFLRKICICMFL